MIRKSINLMLVHLHLWQHLANKESAADIITEADMKAIQEQMQSQED